MSFLRTTLLVATAALALAACKKSSDGKANLPPASGDGATPLPTLPPFQDTPRDAGAATAASENKTTGTLVARAQVTVGAKSSGTIVEIKADEGDHVTKGDVLFRLDSRDAALMRRAAQTQLESAKLQLKTAQREYDRIKALVDQNAAPRVQLDGLEAQVSGARLAITAANNSLAMASKQIADATVRAPMTGVVLTRLMSVGEYATMMPPSPVLVLQDQSVLDLEFSLPEKALASIRIHDVVSVSIPALGVTRAAEITEISPMVNPATRTLQFTAALVNKDGALKPGLMAEVTLGEPPPAPAPAPEVAPAPAPARVAPKKPARVAPKKPPAKKPAAKQPTAKVVP